MVIIIISPECHSAECHSAECHSAECHSVECHSAECHSAECRSAECRGAKSIDCILFSAALQGAQTFVRMGSYRMLNQFWT